MRKILIKYESINVIISFLFIIVLEFCFFRTYAYREVIGNIPRNADQLSYMTVSYSLYENLILRDWHKIVTIIRSRCLTGGIPIIGVINLFVFGRGYFSFLLMNFFAYSLVQIIGGISVYTITEKKRYIYIFIGLFLALMSPFYWAGDLLDFRQDFIAFCLYTCWVTLYVVYLYNNSKRFFYLSAWFGGVLVFCRMLSIVYICIVLLLINLYYVFIYKKVSFRKQIINMFCYAFVMILCGGWFLIIRLKNFFYYYVNLHAKDLEPDIRAKEQKIYDLGDNISFYPKSLIVDHLGIYISIIAVVILLFVVVVYICNRKKYMANQRVCVLFSCLTIITPIVILTLDVSKSSVVVNIVSGCVVWLLTLLIFFSLDYKKNLVFGLVIICSLIGAYSYISNSISQHRGYSAQEQKTLIKINSEIAEYIIEENLKEPHILVDHLFDSIKNESVTYWLAEKYKKNIYVYNAIQTMNPSLDGLNIQSEVARTFSEEEIQESLLCADIVVISPEGYEDSLYVTDQQFDNYREMMWDYVNDNMKLLLEERINGTDISVFVR